MTEAVSVSAVTKRFGPLLANDSVSLSVERGEIFAVVGENGAGKSTLMNLLYGIYRPDAGEVRVKGLPVRFGSPRDAIAHGIGMVHQHFTLVGPMTVAENVVLGDEPARGALFDENSAAQRVERLAGELGFTLDPRAPVESLPVGVQQRVEIVKALSRGAEVLILDEPTAVLTPQEADELFKVLKRLSDAGQTVLFVSHKLAEVTAVSRRVAVMRAGKVVAVLSTAETSARELSTLMVGRELAEVLPRSGREPGGLALSLADVRAEDDRGLPALRGLTLQVRAGEIVGIAGVDGNGQTELVEVIAGLRPLFSGDISVLGGPPAAPAEIARRGAAFIHGDRHHRGVVPGMSLEENLLLGREVEAPFRGVLGVDRAAVRSFAARLVEAFDVRPGDLAAPLRSLSGGNQQKAVLARELDRRPRLLVAAHPTRGVDVGAIEQIHARLLAERDRGTAVLLLSGELEEVLALADRVAVLYEGRIVHEAPAAGTDERSLGPWMTGAVR